MTTVYDVDNIFAAPPEDPELAPYEGQEELPPLPEEEGPEYFDADQLKGLMKQSIDIFGSVVAPEYVVYLFPLFYTYLWSHITSAFHKTRDFSRFAIGLPRGHAKTFVVKLLILYAIMFTDKRYILVAGANQSKAEDIISDVYKMLQHPNIIRLFGDFTRTVDKDTQDLKKFSFNGRKITLEAVGQGTAVRGSSKNNDRPDLIICDDSQTRKGAESVVESQEYHKWFTGDLMKAKSPFGCTFIYIGNMYKDLKIDPEKPNVYCCMLRNLQQDPNWLSMIVGAILVDGTALWEELQPLQQLLIEYESDLRLGQGEVFCAEVLNDPSGIQANRFDANKLVVFERTPDLIHQGNFIVIDPSTSKQTPDQCVLEYYEIFDNHPVCIEREIGKFTGPEQAHKAIDMALRNQCSLICPESVAYQHTLGEWIQYTAEQRGIYGIVVEPVPHRKGNKNSDILRFFESCTKGEYWVTAATKSALVAQAILFDPKRTDNVDDIVDCGAMAMKVALTMRHLMHIQHHYGENTYQTPLPEVLDSSGF